MKLLFSLILLVLSACTTVAPQRQPALAGMGEWPTTSGATTITGDELKQTGRTDLSDALRASSPIFH